MAYLKKIVKHILLSAGIEIRKRREESERIFFDYRRSALFFRLPILFSNIQEVEGDIVECGVGWARTFSILACLVKAEGKNRMLYGFDSFEGFPDPSPEDRSPRNPKRGEWKVIGQENVKRILSSVGLDEAFINSNIKIKKGFFEDTLKNSDVQKIAFLHLDVDLYNSYKVCLEELFPKMARGGVVLFDEYSSTNFPGAKKAIDEYFSQTPHKIQKDIFSNKYYVIKN